MQLKITIVALMMAASSGLVLGQDRIDARQARQQERIDKGVASGQLNEKEAARMQKGQARTQKMEDKARADGVVTKREAAKIERMQDKQSARIYSQKHDKQKAVK
jgi:hypothetical protein